MDEQRAREILGRAITNDGARLSDNGRYVSWSRDHVPEEVTLDGWFTAEYLEAIVWWMRNKA